MAVDPQSPEFVMAVIGTGTMGRGIAQIAAAGGIRVLMFDTQKGAAADAREFITRMINRTAEKGSISFDDAASAIARLDVIESMAELASAHLIVEAIVEDLEVKRQLFTALEKIVSVDCILASNTSSLSVTEIAASCDKPGRVAGYHFFNPVPLLKLVEVIRAEQTSDATVERIEALTKALGKTAVPVGDAPGFAVNRLLVPMINEAAFIVQEGTATPEAIDDAMKLGAAHPMGPLALADLIGLDVCLAIMEVLQEGFGDPKYRPCPLLKRMVAAGYLGRKSGRGFYIYE